ncbi:LytTR family transcriptional regulator [Phaeobacter sp. CNT1-3]|nr:LytTR family transcriptional regulator [Phaeobacter sp. CNT1-3]
MTDPTPQPALREWRRHMTLPETMTILASVWGVLALVGPFGTIDMLNIAERLGYWGVVSIASYGWGSLMAILFRPKLEQRGLILHILASTVATGMGISALVLTMNMLTLDWSPTSEELSRLLPILFGICLIVSASVIHFSHKRRKAAAAALPASSSTDDEVTNTPPIEESVTPADADITPPIWERLPFDKRGPLVALSVEDHYVRIKTLQGEEMILMRLSDAIREVGSTPGAQVHRSHWAAFDQVKSVRREGDRAILTMINGDEIPVSRANMPKIKEAGLLPR